MRKSGAASMSVTGSRFLWPGLRSKVSIWLGPPLIHKRMQARLRSLLLATSAASVSNQPDIEAPMAPAEASFNQSRRDNCERQDGILMGTVLRDLWAKVGQWLSMNSLQLSNAQ